MFRRIILWIEAQKKNARWRAELVRQFPNEASFHAALATRAAREKAVVESVSTLTYRDGYRQGFIEGHCEGFEHGTKVATQLFRDVSDKALLDERMKNTN